MDNKLLNSAKVSNSDILTDFAMQPIRKNSLMIKNGVMFILGGVSSGKSTLISKMIKVYDETIEPMIFCFYSGFAPDETTTHNISNFKLKNLPYFVKLSSPDAMFSFFNQLRHYRLKFSELLMVLKSQFIDDFCLFKCLMLARRLFDGISAKFNTNEYMKRCDLLMNVISENIDLSRPVYQSEFIFKTYANDKKINFYLNPILFLTNCCVSLSKAFNQTTITIENPTGNTTIEKHKPLNIDPMIRFNKQRKQCEIIPCISIFDDIAQFPLLTTERSIQWIKDLFSETRRWMNTFIIAAQRHSLLNKSLRALTHTFFIGYSLIDDDLPKIAKEMPANLLSSSEFLDLYHRVIQPFTFFVYNNKLGFDIVRLKR